MDYIDRSARIVPRKALALQANEATPDHEWPS